MMKTGIIGATGYAGAELVRILAGHPDVEITLLASRQYQGKRFSDIYPAFSGIVDTLLAGFDPETDADLADLYFLALPHKVSMALAPGLIEKNKKVIDLSADYRFRNPEAYEAAYQPHTHPELTRSAAYGLSEIYTADIEKADLVGNPGCYPTCSLLPLVPLIKAGLIEPEGIVIDAKSGVSGAGRNPSVSSLFCEVAESFKAYKVAVHRHNPEIDEVLTHAAGRKTHALFVPHLVPMSRGMLATIYARPAQGATKEDLVKQLADYYKEMPFVRICSRGGLPDTRNVRGTNYCDIGVALDTALNRAVIMSVIDNLVKGAAGQAVQNMNIMCGFDQTRGLESLPRIV